MERRKGAGRKGGGGAEEGGSDESLGVHFDGFWWWWFCLKNEWMSLETNDCCWNERLDECCDEEKNILLVVEPAYMPFDERCSATESCFECAHAVIAVLTIELTLALVKLLPSMLSAANAVMVFCR